MGADNLAGDRFEIVFKNGEEGIVAWLKNRFGALVGYFDVETSRQLNIQRARDWKLCALLSLVAYTDAPEPGCYWGEMALICYDPHNHEESFERFIENIAKSLADGIRPDIDLGEQAVKQIIDSKGEWVPTQRTPLPERKVGTVIMKKRRSFSENIIEQGREGKRGCYIISWAFIAIIAIAIILAAVFGLRSCGVF